MTFEKNSKFLLDSLQNHYRYKILLSSQFLVNFWRLLKNLLLPIPNNKEVSVWDGMLVDWRSVHVVLERLNTLTGIHSPQEGRCVRIRQLTKLKCRRISVLSWFLKLEIVQTNVNIIKRMLLAEAQHRRLHSAF